jgi:hypothetical protein
MPCEALVKPNETWRRNRSGRVPGEEPVRQARISVVEGEEIDGFGKQRHVFLSSAEKLI